MSERAGQIERLVDGELSSEEYCGLLATLEEQPGGWRRCALAFLEAQALALELGQVRRSLDGRGHVAVAGDIAPRANTAWDQGRMLLAVAASFVVALVLGLAAPKFLSLGGKDGIAGGNIINQRPVLVAEDYADDGVAHEVLRYVGDVRLLVDGATEGGQ